MSDSMQRPAHPPKAPIAKMAGDFLREGSALVFVFGVLDTPHGWPAIAIVVGLFVAGAVVERVRR